MNRSLRIKQLEKDYAGALKAVEAIANDKDAVTERLIDTIRERDKASWNLTVAEAEASKATRVSKTAQERMHALGQENDKLRDKLALRSKMDNFVYFGLAFGFAVGFFCAYTAHTIGWH